MDNERVVTKTKAYKPLLVITHFLDDQGNDIMQEQIEHNYNQIKLDILNIIDREKECIRQDPDLQHPLAENC